MHDYLQIKCQLCKKSSWYHIIDNKDTIQCEGCKTILLEYSSCKGFVYILSNPAYNSLLKIGQTYRSIEERIVELNSGTGIPSPFQLEAYFLSENPSQDESILHKELTTNRINQRREFFEIDILKAIAFASKLFNQYPILVSDKAKELYNNSIDIQDKIKKRTASIQEKNRKLSEQKEYYLKIGNFEEINKIDTVLNRINQNKET